MIAKVAPAVRLPGNKDAFDYLIEGDLDIRRGSLVLIPWRGRTVVGVAVGTERESAVPAGKLKAVIGLASARALPDDCLLALEWAAERYLSSLGTIAKCFLPTPPKRLRTSGSEGPDPMAVSAAKRKRGAAAGTVRLYGGPEERRSALLEAVSRCRQSGRSALILAPHREDVRDAVSLLTPEAGERLTEIHGDLAAGRLWRNWEAANSGQATVVVGSRMAALAPLRNLGLIAVLEADSIDHKQYDQAPRYDARAIAKVRAEASGAELFVMTQSPRAEEMDLIRSGFGLEGDSSLPPVVFADISAWGRDWCGPLSPASLERIRQSLQNGQNALIYHNRPGTAGALACGDCRRVSRCVRCDSALSVRRDGLECRRCGAVSPMPATCPECGGANLKPIGWGTEAVESFLKREIPGVAVRRADADSERIGSAPNAQVVIGSRALVHDLSELHGGEFGAVIVTSGEDLLGRSGFRATEDAWGVARKLRCLAARGATDLVIQTLDPEDLKVRSLAEEAVPFLKRELAVRGKAGYPPAARLIVVAASGRTEKEAAGLAEGARKALQAACRRNGPETVLSAPFRPPQSGRRRQWLWAVAIRTPQVGPDLLAALKGLPEGITVDPDPETPT